MASLQFVPLFDFYGTQQPIGEMRPSLRAFTGPWRSEIEGMDPRRCIGGLVRMSLKTKTGSDLLEDTAPGYPVAVLDTVMDSQGMFRRSNDAMPLIHIRPEPTRSGMTTTMNHELQHFWQEINQKKVFRDHRHFRASASRYGDPIIYNLICEADASLTGVINGLELKTLGAPGGWTASEFSSERVLAAALKVSLGKGHGPRSDESKLSMFDAWMTNDYSPRLAAGYESRFLWWLSNDISLGKTYKPGVTQDSELKCVVQNRKYHSYLSRIGLFGHAYLGAVSYVETPADLEWARSNIEHRSATVGQTLHINQVLEKLEDNHSNSRKLINLMPDYDPPFASQTLATGKFSDRFENLVQYGCDTTEPFGVVETSIPALIARCGRLADIADPSIGDPLAVAAQRAERAFQARTLSAKPPATQTPLLHATRMRQMQVAVARQAV